MRRVLLLCFLMTSVSLIYAQNSIKDLLMNQGAWFLFSVKTEEHFDDEKTFAQVDFFKKDDVSSIFFDQDDRLYSVFTKDGTEVMEDLWRLVDETHFVMVSPVDSLPQLVDILELTPKQLVIRNCFDIDGGTSCVIYTYFSTKDGWLSDREIDELNSAGVIDLGNLSESIQN